MGGYYSIFPQIQMLVIFFETFSGFMRLISIWIYVFELEKAEKRRFFCELFSIIACSISLQKLLEGFML